MAADIELTESQERLNRLFHELLERFEGGISNTSTRKFDNIRRFLARLVELSEDDIYIVSAGTRPGNLNVRLSQGLQATRHTTLGIGVVRATLEEVESISNLSDGAITAARNFIGRGDASYDNFGIIVQVGDTLRFTRLLAERTSPVYERLISHFPEMQLVDTGSVGTPTSTTSPDETAETGDVQAPLTVKHPMNLILYGPPGTGKTYKAIRKAIEIIDSSLPSTEVQVTDRFRKLQEDWRIGFVTFHQSFSYEDFVEGIRPVIDSGQGSDLPAYEIRGGIFKKMCDLASEGILAPRSVHAFDPSSINFWKMSLGNTQEPGEAHIFNYCIENSCILLGYGRGLDFAGCDNRNSVLSRLQTVDPTMTNDNYNVTSVNTFKNSMKEGDIVIVSEGNDKFRAIGRISGDYTHDSSLEFSQKRAVEWLVVLIESLPKERILHRKSFSQKTIYQILSSDLKLDTLQEMLSERREERAGNYVLIIDEINRGNISKIFGELITLLEPDKRRGGDNELSATLPYSQKSFVVPENLYVIGTMNTADKSIALVDVALRRRFEFEEIRPDFSLCEELNSNMHGVLSELNRRIVIRKDRDHRIGHSYFMEVTDTDTFNKVFKRNLIPLLQDYFWNDWEGLRFVIGEDTGTTKIVVPIEGSAVNSGVNSWQWYFDVDTADPDFLESLMENYGITEQGNA